MYEHVCMRAFVIVTRRSYILSSHNSSLSLSRVLQPKLT